MSNRYTDRNGHEWTIDVTISSIKRVKQGTGVDLVDIVKGDLASKLNDPMILCDVLWTLVEPQARLAGIEPEQFGDGLAGDSLDAAIESLLEGIVNFFPKSRRDLLNKMLGKARNSESAALTRANQMIDSPEFNAELEKMFGETSGELQESQG